MKILIVEDEQRIAGAIKKVLVSYQFEVETTANGESGLEAATTRKFDLVILDRMLPGKLDGADIASKLRHAEVHVPILMLTARAMTEERIEGLDSGADDYLVKPFSMDELVARIQALLRRSPVTKKTVLKAGDLELDMASKEVTREGQAINLSPTEFRLLKYLMLNQGKTITKDQLLTHGWDETSMTGRNSVELHISHLRQKIDKPFGKQLIKTVHGFGYRLDGDV
jgi:DNA-binding response OmpR family regulator